MDVFSSINTWAFDFSKSIASPLLNAFMNYWSYSFVIILPFVFIYLYLKKDDNLVPYTVAVVALFLVCEIIKDIVREPRPCALTDYSWINQVGCDSGYSFPSDHAMTLTGLFIFLKNYRYVQAAYVIWLVVILFGRIYLGQHFLTDVIAGAVLGIIGSYSIYRFKGPINRAAYKYAGFLLPKIKIGA